MKPGQTVLEAKRYGCYMCTSDATLLDAAHRMVKEDISALVVIDVDGDLTGIITRSDLLHAHLTHDAWMTQPVASHMTREVITALAEDELHYVANLLLDKHVHRVVVVRPEDGKQKPIAVVSDADLVYHMVKEAAEA